MATPAKFTLTVTTPPSGATDPDTIARSIVKSALAQASQQVGDTRLTSGSVTYNAGSGNQEIGTWAFTAPA